MAKTEKALQAKEKLTKFVTRIEKELSKYLNSELKNVFSVSKDEKELSTHVFNHIREHDLRPAKRLRGSFIYYGYKLFKNDKDNEVLKAAMSIEMIHTGLLMHDDFQDQDDTRRGLPTTHEYYKKYHTSNKFRFDPLHYGEGVATNAGSIALLIGYELLGKTNFENSLKIDALNRTFRGIINTEYGQIYDLTLEGRGSASEKDITNLHHGKTSIYTYENPLHIGAILAGANKKDLEILTKYAIPGGISFQLQDDILGLFGTPERTGKPAHSDLRQGKMTLLIVKALEFANPSQKKRILEVWGNHKLTEDEAEEIRKIVKDCGSLDYSKKTAIKWARKAQEAIPEMLKRKWNKESVEYLDGIAQYMIERDL